MNFSSLTIKFYNRDHANEGDCCWDVNSDICFECTCQCQNLHLVSNGFCNDDTNNPECNYDDGDCCVNVKTDYCSACLCSASGVITSPGFPQSYGNHLDLTWLIQLPSGQFIKIVFLSFDVEDDSSCK